MTTISMNEAPRRFDFKIFDAMKTIGTLLLGAIVAYGAAQYSAAERDGKIKANSDDVATIKSNLVPRSEAEAHWRETGNTLAQIQSDMREVRNMNNSILLLLSNRTPVPSAQMRLESDGLR